MDAIGVHHAEMRLRAEIAAKAQEIVDGIVAAVRHSRLIVDRRQHAHISPPIFPLILSAPSGVTMRRV